MTDYKFVEPKTQASIRTIYIDSDTLNELKAWQSVQQQVLPKTVFSMLTGSYLSLPV